MSRLACTRPVVLSADEHRRAVAHARQRLRDRYDGVGRAVPAPRDDELFERRITRRLIDEAAAVIDADPELCEWVAAKLAASKRLAGRPSDLCVRTGLMLCWILAVVTREFNLFELSHLLITMDWRDRRELGIDCLRSGVPTQVSYDQLLEFLHDLHSTFDAWDETLPDTDDGWAIRDVRAQDLQEFIDRLIACSTAAAPVWCGDAAIDATAKWSWEQPPGKNDKKPARGKNGGEGPPITIADIIEAAGSAEAAGITEDVDAATTTQNAVNRRTKRRKRWRNTWGLGAAWAGRPNIKKAVHGYFNHVVTRSDTGGPHLVEMFCIAPANAHARAVGLPMLHRLHARRQADPAVRAEVEAGRARYLGDVSADPAYSDAAAWPLTLRKLGASPVMRLHRKNQQPPQRIEIAPGVHVVNFFGRVFCPCVEHTGLLELRYPNFPYTLKELHDFQAELPKLAPYMWRPNAVLDDGRRQLLRPHDIGPDGQTGGCEHCVHRDGTSVIGADGRPRSRCCAKASRRFRPEQIPFWQDELFGSEAWYRDWNKRNIVEGTFGIVRCASVINFGNAYHRFVGLAHETIVNAFMLCAYNFHMLRTWRKKRALMDDDAPDDSAIRVTATLPARPEPKFDRPRTGPKGLAALGQPRAGP